MNTSEYSNRCSRVIVACLIASMMILGPLAPLSLASAGSKVQRAPVHKGPSTSANPKAAPLTPFAVNITATKVDAYPSHPSGKANPGDTIDYTVTISNTGTTDATGVTFTDSVDPNTTLVPGSAQTQPMAAPDQYSVLGNVRIQPNAAAGLLANDIDPDTGNNSGLTASGPVSSTQGGSVSVNTDGSFSYNPPAGFEGSDTFTYTITDTTGKTDTATVTLTVTGMIWFINAAASPGDGRLTTPFNCLTGAGCFSSVNDGAGLHPAAGDNIFLYSGSYTGGLTLLNNQKLIGQGASAALNTIAGVTVPAHSDPLPVTGGANPTITSGANGVNLGQGNTLRGFTIGNTTGTKIFGSTFGTLTVGNNTTPDMLLNGTGQALNLTTGTFAATSAFSGITSSGGTNGVSLTNVAGTANFGGGTLSGTSGATFLVSGGSATITYSGSITQNNAARVVDIQTTTGGAFTLSGTVTAGASSTGVILNADNGNVSFTTLNLGTSLARMTNQALTITGGTGTYSLGTVAIFTNSAQGIVATKDRKSVV